MPELPEVETVVRGLRRAGLVGRTVQDVKVRWPRTIHTPAPAAFCRNLQGRRITALHRRAKYICLELDNGAMLLIHLRMTGRLHIQAAGEPLTSHHHVILRLDDRRELRYHDTRKFGRWYLVADPLSVLGRAGPEPFDPALTPASFAARLRGHARMLKPLLLDQAVLAGLGNIYVDEALWDAELHPGRQAASLTPEQGARLLASIRTVLRRGIRAQGTSLGRGSANFYSVAGRRGRNQDGLRVFRRTGDPCPRCGTPIVRLRVAQRSTHVCPRCQRENPEK